MVQDAEVLTFIDLVATRESGSLYRGECLSSSHNISVIWTEMGTEIDIRELGDLEIL